MAKSGRKIKMTVPAPTEQEMQQVGMVPNPEPVKELSGKCPICSGVLVEQGEYYKCSDHYLIVKQSFETAWQVYLDKMECTNVAEDQMAAGRMLLEMLLNTNVAENKPLIKHIWRVDHDRYDKDNTAG
jgi:hypothetical protein